MHPSLGWVFGALLLSCAGSSVAQVPVAQPAVAEAADQSEIVVIGLKDPFTLTAKQFAAMMAAFAKGRPVNAPDARLFIEVKDAGEGIPADIRFILRGPDSDVVLPVEGGRVVLPESLPPGGPFQLVTNLSRNRINVSLWVMSPGSTDARRTMGDLRLQCDVMWAAAKDMVSPIVRTMFGAAGACKSASIAFYFRSARPLVSGNVEFDGKSVPIMVGKNQLAYRAPIYDKSIPNSAAVNIQFK